MISTISREQLAVPHPLVNKPSLPDQPKNMIQPQCTPSGWRYTWSKPQHGGSGVGSSGHSIARDNRPLHLPHIWSDNSSTVI